MKTNPSKIFAIFIALLLPFIILMGGVRILLSFNYPGFQYGLIGFPEDSFGYSREERTKLADATVRYLTADQKITSLTEIKDSLGRTVYTAEEVSHLQDVKNVIDLTSLIWYVVCGLSIAFLIWMLVTKSWTQLRHSFFWGAVLTILLMLTVVVFTVFSFNALFEKFHAIFFPQGNWTFSESSALIRLFPLPLWLNAFILISVYALLISLLLLIVFWPRKRAPKVYERIVPVAIPSSKQATNIPNMATPVNPFLSEDRQEGTVNTLENTVEKPNPIMDLYHPEGGTGLPGNNSEEPKS